jgi:hypothetical protein
MLYKNNTETKKTLFYFIPALIILTIGLLLLMNSCATVKEVPVQTIEKVVYRDSLVYIQDTLRVEIPTEIVKEVVPQIDTSYLRTSYAESVAYLDTVKKKLHHTLEQKGEIKIKYDTIIKVQYVDRIIKQDVPIEVEVIKYKRDSLFWALLGWAIFCVVLVGLKIFVLK